MPKLFSIRRNIPGPFPVENAIYNGNIEDTEILVGEIYDDIIID